MQDKDIYQQILGLKSPWFVAEVKLDTANQQVDIYVEHPAATKFCYPDCQQELSCYDHTSPRTWRHLDTMQFKTMLHAAILRVKCPEHGVKKVSVPWAEGSSHPLQPGAMRSDGAAGLKKQIPSSNPQQSHLPVRRSRVPRTGARPLPHTHHRHQE